MFILSWVLFSLRMAILSDLRTLLPNSVRGGRKEGREGGREGGR